MLEFALSKSNSGYAERSRNPNLGITGGLHVRSIIPLTDVLERSSLSQGVEGTVEESAGGQRRSIPIQDASRALEKAISSLARQESEPAIGPKVIGIIFDAANFDGLDPKAKATLLRVLGQSRDGVVTPGFVIKARHALVQANEALCEKRGNFILSLASSPWSNN